MYAQLGASYGGIVANLSLDGIACLTATRLPAEKNLSFDMKLRGAGLKVELSGEVVWLGPTQKKAGIRFKNVSPETRKEISDWIVRESQVSEPVAIDGESPANSLPGSSATTQSSGSRPLSIAPETSRADSAKPGSNEYGGQLEGGFDPPSAASLNSARANPRVAPLDAVLPFQPRNIFVDNPAARVPTSNAASRPRNAALFEPISSENPYRVPNQNVSPAVAPENAGPLVREEQPKPSVERAAKSEAADSKESKTTESPSAAEPVRENVFPKTPETESARLPVPSGIALRAGVSGVNKKAPVISQEAVAPAKQPAAKSEIPKTEKIAAAATVRDAMPFSGSLHSQAAARWIPPAILDLWRLGDRTQKYLMVGLGIACVGSFMLILGLTVARVAGSASPTAQGMPPAVAQSIRNFVTAHDAAAAGEAQAATEPDESEAAPSIFVYLADKFFGIDSEMDGSYLRAPIAIDPSRVAVKVWTSKNSGFYYCTNDKYDIPAKPGALMTQRDALQNGYQPKLGQFCN